MLSGRPTWSYLMSAGALAPARTHYSVLVTACRSTELKPRGLGTQP